jgi:hypothetical protein
MCGFDSGAGGSRLLTMKQPLDFRPTPDHVRAALEASCGALIALELIRARMTDAADDVRSMQGHITEAIDSLTQAIGELRLARDDQASAVALGFVLRPGSC